jgi:L-alanine-DL-glutamate epimerase-like enolase superfamily enzyme
MCLGSVFIALLAATVRWPGRMTTQAPSRLIQLDTIRTELQPNAVIVVLHTDRGETGLGETFWGSPAVEAYLHETAAPVLARLDTVAPTAVAAALQPYVGFSGSGAEIRGNGAIDIALWDILGKLADQPISRLLGGPLAGTIRVYNTCAGYDYIKDDGRQSSSKRGLPTGTARPYDDLAGFLERPAELARSLLEEGYTAMKVWPFDAAAEASRGQHIGMGELGKGIGILEAIRSEVGDAMDILVEMHGLWSLPVATTILTALKDSRPFWVEDPIRNDAVDAYRRLRERVEVPVAAGEALGGVRGFKPLFEAGALDVGIVDLGWAGGIGEAIRVASLADTYGVGFALHDCTGPVSFAACVQVASSQRNVLIAETVRAFLAGWYPEAVEGLPAVENGVVEIPHRPGLGLTLRDEFLARPGTTVRSTRL